jgi:DNA-binding NarL/FixJ family response regulator
VAGKFQVSQERLDKAQALLDDGASFLEVSRTLNMSISTIKRRLPEYSPWTHEQVAAHGTFVSNMNKAMRRGFVKPKPKPEPKPEVLSPSQKLDIRTAFRQGKSQVQLAKQYGVSRRTIQRAIEHVVW